MYRNTLRFWYHKSVLLFLGGKQTNSVDFLPGWNKEVHDVDDSDEGVSGEVLEVEGVEPHLVEERPVHQGTHCSTHNNIDATNITNITGEGGALS